MLLPHQQSTWALSGCREAEELPRSSMAEDEQYTKYIVIFYLYSVSYCYFLIIYIVDLSS